MSIKIDLHIHSKYSHDSQTEPEDILGAAKKSGLGGIAVVDHGTIKGGVAAGKANKESDFIVITGSEIKTDIGEVIGYFLHDEIKSRAFYEVIDEMRDQDALISIPHPFDTFRFNRIRDPDRIASYVDAVEVYNSRCVLDSSNKKAFAFSNTHGVGITAGSDAHDLDEIGSAGIILKGERIREEMTNNREFFGKKNPIFLHAKTTLQKLIPK